MIIYYPTIVKDKITNKTRLKWWLQSYERSLKLKTDEIRIVILANCDAFKRLEPIASHDSKPIWRNPDDGESTSFLSFPEKSGAGTNSVSGIGVPENAKGGYYRSRFYGISDAYTTEKMHDYFGNEIKPDYRNEKRRCPIFYYYTLYDQHVESFKLPPTSENEYGYSRDNFHRVLESRIDKINNGIARVTIRTNLFVGFRELPFYEIDRKDEEVYDDEALIEETEDTLGFVFNVEHDSSNHDIEFTIKHKDEIKD